MSQVKITRAKNRSGEERLWVFSPYHPDFPARARELGGRWAASDKQWSFDPRDEERVKKVLREVYGEDGSPADLVTVKVDLDSLRDTCASNSQLFLFGREIAVRFGRDSHVKLGRGVVVTNGRFPSSGGSAKHPCLAGIADVLPDIEIRDVPRTLAEQEIQKLDPGTAEILCEGPVEKLATLAPDPTTEQLTQKIAEIEAQIRELQEQEQKLRLEAQLPPVSVALG